MEYLGQWVRGVQVPGEEYLEKKGIRGTLRLGEGATNRRGPNAVRAEADS